ncbi:MAG: hypothetical protein RBS17_09885 [Coriobacteriia bacterium]|nr:hypothetical protein [Coriobacteriia bacterium]
MRFRRTESSVIAAILCFVVLLGGQSLTDASVGEFGRTDTGQLLGGATSSYLTGIKRFVAAGLWNRMHPIFHNYYEGVGVSSQLHMLPTIAMVQMLDPQLVQPYYIGAWMLARNDRLEEAITMAEGGIYVNPDAGILYVNLAQLKYLDAHDLDGAVEVGEKVLEREMWWTDFTEEYNAYPALRAIFVAAERDDLVQVVDVKLALLDIEAESGLGSDSQLHEHDHDDDGVSDH